LRFAFQRERLKEEDAAQCRAFGSWRNRRAGSSGPFKVASAWKHDSSMHHMISHQRPQLSRDGRPKHSLARRTRR
jgi:hypothetical protein